MCIHGIFPTPIGIYQLERSLSDTELQYISKLDRRANVGNYTSVDDNILADSILEKLQQFFYVSLNDYFKRVYSPKNNVELYITQCWANYTSQGQFHHEHEHQNSIISGVFYVSTDDQSDRILFHKRQYQQITFDVDEFNIFNSDKWFFEAIPNQLILFPSSLTHNVETVTNNSTRVSISFNTFVRGEIGSRKNLTKLTIA